MKYLLVFTARVLSTLVTPLFAVIASAYGFWIITKVSVKCTWSSEYRAATMRRIGLLKEFLEGAKNDLESRGIEL